MKVGIVGVGVVGQAVQYGMEKIGHSVDVHDLKMSTSIVDVLNTDLCFICVPTPQLNSGGCDSSVVEKVVENLVDLKYRGIIAIKSTVTPGTTQRLIDKYCGYKICFVPEFLRERHAISDFTENHDICVIGADCADKSSIVDIVKKSHGKYPKSFISMSPTEAELTKYFSNVFNALRITFANGFFEVCQKLDADYSIIKNAIVSRPTLTDLYLDCNDNFRGFAGVCLPKDTAAFAKLASELGVSAQIFDTIIKDNRLYDATVMEGMRKE